MDKYNHLTEKLHHAMKETLTPGRLEHSLGVAYTAANLCFVHGADIGKALTAGMLHDCAKCIPDMQKLKLARKYGLPVSEYEEEEPGLLHASLGAYFAKHKYGVHDEDVLDAIRSHTTGQPDMTLLQKVIFIADFIEPNRKPLPIMPGIRREAYEDPDLCVLHILEGTLEYLDTKNKVKDPRTRESYEYYLEYVNAKQRTES